MNNILTASRMNSLMHCPRAHFWAYEIGLSKETDSVALHFGSAWHRAMEYRWLGKSYDDALTYAIPEGINLDAYVCSTIAALLAGYYDHYGPKETVGKLNPEEQFAHAIEGTNFESQGKIDGLGTLKRGGHVLVESKTTSDSLLPDSDYWLRLRFNLQLYQYYDAATVKGWEIQEVIYDVTRKPSIRPMQSVDELDEDGLKIVVDQEGNRVFNTKGKNKGLPRQSGDKAKGYVVKSHKETPDEFCDRLYQDTLARPEFYFCRKEVPILESDFQQFKNQRIALVGMIEDFRERETILVKGIEKEKYYRNQEAWPRNVSTNTCNFCAYKSFCLRNNSIDLDNLPEGYSIQPFNPELAYADTTESENVDTSAS